MDHDRVDVFVASCAERVRQVFTGLVADDDKRDGDLDRVVRIADALWDVGGESSWDGDLRFLESLPEIKKSGSTDGKSAVLHSVAMVIFCAVRYRSFRNSEDAIRCSDFALNSSSLISDYRGLEFDIRSLESNYQRSDIASLSGVGVLEEINILAMKVRAEEFSFEQLRGEFF
ncbi:hypothetical protein [Nocardiopsis flavescens]